MGRGFGLGVKRLELGVLGFGLGVWEFWVMSLELRVLELGVLGCFGFYFAFGLFYFEFGLF
jgi:hypothetical protein